VHDESNRAFISLEKRVALVAKRNERHYSQLFTDEKLALYSII